MVKAFFIERGAGSLDPSNIKSPESSVFHNSGIVTPPYDPAVLCKLHEHSSSLRQNVDAYRVNIDGHGHRFEPTIDLESTSVEEDISNAMFLDKLIEAENDSFGEEGGGDGSGTQDQDSALLSVEPPSEAEVVKKIEELRRIMQWERAKITEFFQYCCPDLSFLGLRKQTRGDVEIMGNGYWEVLRNAKGQPAVFNYIPGFTMRLLPMGDAEIEVSEKVKRAPLTFEDLPVRRRFRRYIQVGEQARKTFFKEFGDPRVMSAKDGQFYEDEKSMQLAENPNNDPNIVVRKATEVIHFSVHSPSSPYGVPRWIGNLLSVLGTRQAEEVNFLYFDNKGVPPMAVLVSGGRMGADSVSKIEDFVNNRIKGRTNFHKIMVIEAEPTGDMSTSLDGRASGTTKIEIVPLTGSQHNDALFQNYDERGIDKVGMSFRLPRLLRGDIRDFNRSTADAALEFAELQVFEPERQDFDWVINRKILSALGIRFWKFVSNSPVSSNAMEIAEIAAMLVDSAILTPNEGRELISAALNRDFDRLEELWAQIPPELLKNGILPDDLGGAPARDDKEDDSDSQDAPGDEEAEEGEEETGEGGSGSQGRTGAKKRARRGPLWKRYLDAQNHANLRKLARELVQMRQALEAAESQAADREVFGKEKYTKLEREHVVLPAAEFAKLLGGDAD